MVIGEEIGRGIRSVVYAWGEREAVKLADSGTPESWLREEARLAQSVRRSGAPTAGGWRIVEIGERIALASERIRGDTMWSLLCAHPDQAAELGRMLAAVHLEVLRCTPSYELPVQRDRIVAKISAAARSHGHDLERAADLVPAAPRAMALCHGDLHPRNVMMAADGPLLVDWFDACRGDPAGDVARSLLLIDESIAAVAADLAAALVVLRDRYRDEMRDVLDGGMAERVWSVVQGVARLAEGLGTERVADLRRALGSLVD